MKMLFSLFFTVFNFSIVISQQKILVKPRARDLNIPFDGKPGRNNAITDVKGVMVGYKTLIRDSGQHAVRTGVTVILPNGRSIDPVPAGWFTLNGDGEMTGTTVIDEYGFNYGPIGITNTNSVGVVRDAIGEWNITHFNDCPLFGLGQVPRFFNSCYY